MSNSPKQKDSLFKPLFSYVLLCLNFENLGESENQLKLFCLSSAWKQKQNDQVKQVYQIKVSSLIKYSIQNARRTFENPV